MSSGEASRSSFGKTNQNGMPACHSSERRGALHPQHHFSSPQLSGGMEDLSKNRSKFSISRTGLLLPRVSDPPYSDMPSKCAYGAKEEKGGEVMACMRVSQAECDAGCAHSPSSSGHELSLRQEEKRMRAGQVGCPEPTPTFLTSP